MRILFVLFLTSIAAFGQHYPTNSPASVSLTWDASFPPDRVNGYVVYHAIDDGPYEAIATNIPTELTLSVKVWPGVHRFYVVVVDSVWGETFPSNILELPAPASLPQLTTLVLTINNKTTVLPVATAEAKPVMKPLVDRTGKSSPLPPIPQTKIKP